MPTSEPIHSEPPPPSDSGGPTAPPRPVSFETFFDEHYVALVRLAALLCGDTGRAEELVQEAMVCVHERWQTLDAPMAFARTCVVNRCHDVTRRAGRFRRRQHLLAAPDVDTDAGLAGDRVAVRSELIDALARLRAPQRTALVLRYYGGCSIAEVATALDVPVGTAKSHVQRGLDELRKVVRP